MMFKRSTMALATSLALLFSGFALASTAEDESREAMQEKSADSQPGEGMMEEHNDGMLEGSDAATTKRQEMMEEPTDPSSADGKMHEHNEEMMEGSDAANEKRETMMEDQDG